MSGGEPNPLKEAVSTLGVVVGIIVILILLFGLFVEVLKLLNIPI